MATVTLVKKKVEKEVEGERGKERGDGHSCVQGGDKNISKLETMRMKY